MADTPALPEGVTHWDGPPLENWRAWSPAEAAAVLAGVNAPWCVVGGWSIDLWLARETRKHEDLEIAVPLCDFEPVRDRLESLGLALFDIGDGEVWALPPGRPPSPEKHQTWVMDPATQLWRVDVMREGGDADTWVYRRDPSLTAPRAEVTGVTAEGVRYIAPQVALLFKARKPREKDEADFVTALPHLSPDARAWLSEWVRRLHPESPWIDRLG